MLADLFSLLQNFGQNSGLVENLTKAICMNVISFYSLWLYKRPMLVWYYHSLKYLNLGHHWKYNVLMKLGFSSILLG